MRLLLSAAFSRSLLLALCPPIIEAINLDQWQPINGFSQACVNAYNTPLSGCMASDFQDGSCSTRCIAFLEALTKILKAECVDASASQGTLIEAFFNDEGTSQICPNVLGGENEKSYGTIILVGVLSTSAPDSYVSTSTTTPISSTTETAPILSAAPSISTSSRQRTSSSASVAATTTQVAIVKTTIVPNAVLPTSSYPSATRQQTQSVATSRASASVSTSGGGGDSGGSPLDVGSTSSSAYNAKMDIWVVSFMTGLAGLALMF